MIASQLFPGEDRRPCWGRSRRRPRQKGRSGVFFARPAVRLTLLCFFPLQDASTCGWSGQAKHGEQRTKSQH